MRILIIGAGEVGIHLARVLTEERHQVVVVDSDAEQLSRIEEMLDVQVVLGHGASATILERAGAFNTDILLAVSSQDEVNLLAALFGKSMGAKRTIVRIKNSEYVRYHKPFYKRVLEYDSMLVLNDLCSQEIAELVRQHRAIAVENFAAGKIQMRQLKVTEDSAWVGMTLAKAKIPKGILVTAVIGEQEIVIPRGDTRINLGDELLLIGRQDTMENVEDITERLNKGVRNMILMGGGDVGLSVAQAFEYSGVRVKLLEADLARAKTLSETLDDVVVIHGDGTDINLLTEMGAGSTDVFVASGGQDETNLMACQLAKALGAKKTIALVDKPDYVPLYHKLGIDAAISPRLLVAQKILRYVRSGLISTIAVIQEGKAEVIEMKALKGSKIIGTPLRKLGFPKGAVIGSILRGNEVIIPDGNEVIQPEDSCIIFTFLENVPLVEKLFAPRKK